MTPPHDPTATAAIRDAAARILARYPSHRDRADRLARICHDEGIEVLDADLSDVAGVLRQEGSRWRLYLSRQDTPRRRVFTLAHLLGHFFLHGSDQRTFVESPFVAPSAPRGVR